MKLSNPKHTARRAGLRYVDPAKPGIRRERRGGAFRYLDLSGRVVRDRKLLARIRALVLPPAWREVWICPHANGHLQATGFDARGRRQYRYHDDWTRNRNDRKFANMCEFGKRLPAIRRRVARDLKLHGMPRDKVIACIVRLLDRSMIRIGNDEYARTNKSYGLTTIHNRHARVSGDDIHFCFRAKSGKECEVTITDQRVAKIIRRCQDLPGQELFTYVDDRGQHRDVGSGHVNDYLFRITGIRFTAKDFRTWGGTVVAAQTLLDCGRPAAGGNGRAIPERELKSREVAAVRTAAEALSNTVATCRKFYVHPRLKEAYAQGLLHNCMKQARQNPRPVALSITERAVWRLVKAL